MALAVPDGIYGFSHLFSFCKAYMLNISSAVLELLAAEPEHSFQGCHHHGVSKSPAGLVPERPPHGSAGIGPVTPRTGTRHSTTAPMLHGCVKLSLQPPRTQSATIQLHVVSLYNVKSRARLRKVLGRLRVHSQPRLRVSTSAAGRWLGSVLTDPRLR